MPRPFQVGDVVWIVTNGHAGPCRILGFLGTEPDFARVDCIRYPDGCLFINTRNLSHHDPQNPT